ncbi:hypothetical protein EB75_19640 [Mycobacterium sp. ST-F2]|nr:hypothetical protein EB75_19640 [Mycobacterium sp. ST-F2]
MFSMAGGEEIAKAVAVTPHNAVGFPVVARAAELIRRQREVTVGPQGPWLRLLFDLDAAGEVKVSFDYGDSEIPADQLLAGEAYLRDFEMYPRPDVPVWLLAHMGDEGQQARNPVRAQQDSVGPAQVHQAADEIPELRELWARMAVVAALCRGSDTSIGPRVDPAFAVHRGDNGGCTLARLPGNRAVLSGGRTDSVLLSQAYKGAIAWPDLYAGAPWWVQDLYLDPRAARGMLSFCYWWDGRAWLRSELPSAATPSGDPVWRPTDEIVAGMPGVWTVETTAELVVKLLNRIGVELADRNAYAAVYLVRAAEAGVASVRYLNRLFVDGVPDSFSVAEALAQLDAAGVLLPAYPPIDEQTAKALVVDYCHANNIDAADYPLDALVAARLDAGWQVFVPVAPGEIAIGRGFFMVADDRVVEQASTSVLPDDLALIFATRFAFRVRGRNRPK